MGSHKRHKGSPCCANERLRNARQLDSKAGSWVDLLVFAPKILKIVDEKIRHGAEIWIFEILWCVTYLYAE
jgi:hypothetical protein